MADSARLPGSHGWPALPTPFYQWFRQVDAAITSGSSAAVNLAALTARVAALEDGDTGGVTSFKGRTGAVVPIVGDYSQWFQLASTTLDVFAATDLTAFADGDVAAWDAATETFVPGAASGGGGVLPVVTGELVSGQPVFVCAPDGSLIYLPV